MAVVVQRFEVYLVSLGPTVGGEIQKSRLCLISSPDEMHRHINTVLIAPMTTRGRDYPTRVSCTFQGRQEQIVLDPDPHGGQDQAPQKTWTDQSSNAEGCVGDSA